MPTLPTTPERELRQKLTKLLPSQDCDVCNGLGGWTSETFTTAGMKWVVCDKCHGLPDSELVDSIMALLSTELSAQATSIFTDITKSIILSESQRKQLASLRSKWEGK